MPRIPSRVRALSHPAVPARTKKCSCAPSEQIRARALPGAPQCEQSTDNLRPMPTTSLAAFTTMPASTQPQHLFLILIVAHSSSCLTLYSAVRPEASRSRRDARISAGARPLRLPGERRRGNAGQSPSQRSDDREMGCGSETEHSGSTQDCVCRDAICRSGACRTSRCHLHHKVSYERFQFRLSY